MQVVLSRVDRAHTRNRPSATLDGSLRGKTAGHRHAYCVQATDPGQAGTRQGTAERSHDGARHRGRV